MDDNEKLEEFKTQLNTLKPEGIEDEAWNKVIDAVVDFHNSDIRALKITNADLKKEKQEEIEKRKDLETSVADKDDKLKDLQTKLEANQPEELKKFYEQQQKQLSEVFSKKEVDYKNQLEANQKTISDLQTQVLKGDVLSEFNTAAAKYNWLGGGRDIAQQMICGKDGSNFSRVNLGEGNSVLANSDKEDVAGAMKKFLDTDVGKHLIQSGSSGGGADGSNATNLGGGKTITMAQFQNLSPADQMKYTTELGYTIV